MRSRVSGRIDSLPFKARETVAVETPASLAMSNIWTLRLFTLRVCADCV
jgi:hypothetical protein